MTGLTLLSLVYRAVDNPAPFDKAFNFRVTGDAQLSRLIQKVLGEIRTVRIVAQDTIALYRRMDMASLSVLLDFLFVTDHAKFITLSNK